MSDGGYLTDPDSEYERLFNKNALIFESISAKKCLVLLGEPGLGKSFTMKSALEEAAIEAAAVDGVLFHKDLRSYGEESRLIREVFEAPEFLTWLEGTHNLYLFLDSFDEARMRIETLSSILDERLQKCPY
ncbi:MAG: AAA family ATPase [Acidobacteriota bacterium]